MSFVYDRDGIPRYYGIYMGLVVDNADPDKMGRVTITVPGLVEPASTWAWPFGTGGGAKQSGAWDVPKRGAAVGVMFLQGDVDEPVYLHGWYGRGDAPTPVGGASAEEAADGIKCMESDRHLVVLDGRSGKEQVLVKDKETGNCIVLKGDEVLLGGEKMLPMQGVLNGESTDPFTGMKHWQLGNASRVVFAKKG